MNSCSHPHVLVTGASSGIGRATAVEPATVRSEAVGKLERDAARLMSQASPDQRDLYEEAFGHLVDTFAARHRHGSPPEVIATTVARALTTPRPRARYLTGKDSRRMAILAAALPAPALDALRRQPAPGSRVDAPQPAEAAEPAMR